AGRSRPSSPDSRQTSDRPRTPAESLRPSESARRDESRGRGRASRTKHGDGAELAPGATTRVSVCVRGQAMYMVSRKDFVGAAVGVDVGAVFGAGVAPDLKIWGPA